MHVQHCASPVHWCAEVQVCTMQHAHEARMRRVSTGASQTQRTRVTARQNMVLARGILKGDPVNADVWRHRRMLWPSLAAPFPR
eukprot:15430120-Alexandrium_andersonii.AAC.1